MTKREHWEKAYSTNPLDKLGWYAPRAETSLNWSCTSSRAVQSKYICVAVFANQLD